MAHSSGPRRTIGSWEILEVVGSGSFAIVWKARHLTTGTLAAVKEILSDRLNKKLHESLESEIAVLQKLKHANIVGLLDLFKEPGKIFLVLEYCAGGDLAQHLRQRGPLSEASCRYLLRQLAEGLKVLRHHNVIHRDLKPQNLLLSDNGPSPTLKIADFGFARSLQPAGLAETLCGSPLYMAPEVLQLHRYDAKADLWSVGTILFELLTGKPPFNGANHLQLIQNIERGDAVLPDHLARSLSPGCRQLLHQLLRRNPVERISFDELFAHPFLLGEAASAAMPLPPSTAGAAAGGSGASDPQQDHYQRRHTPTSHGAVRFVQPLRTGSPVHPAVAVPPSPTNTQQQQRAQQHGGEPAPGAAAGPGPGSDPLAGAGTGPPTGVGAIAAINVRELTRSPSPRIIAAAAAVASALQTDAAATAATAAAPGPVAAATAGGGNGGATAQGGAASGLSSVPLADSLDSDYVVVASPSAASRPAYTPLSPRIPHPAMACGSGRSSRNGSAGGAAPAAAAAVPSEADAAATAAGGRVGGAVAAAGTGPPAAALAGTAAPPPPSWQQLPSPIAAATLPPYTPSTGAAATLAQTPHHHPIPLAAAAGSAAAASGPSLVLAPATNPATATTVTIRVPPPGCLDGDAGDPLLIPRVVGLLLDHARSRCTALLDQEVEARQLGETHAAAAAAGGGSFAAGAGFGGGAAAGIAVSGGAGGGVRMADEAAAAVGTLLVACRLLVAALSASTTGAAGASEGGGSGSGGDMAASVAATADPAAAPQGSIAAAEAALEGAAAAATVHGSGGRGRPGGEVSTAAAGPSLAALAALAVHARSLLAALDEHLHGTVARMLLNGGDGGDALTQPPDRPREGAAPGNSPAAAHLPTVVVPCGLDALLAAAVHHSRAAAGEELLGNAAGAADQYGRAADVLLFLLAAQQQHQHQHHLHPQVQQQQQQPTACGQEALLESVRPPLAPADRQRLTKYYAAVRLRQSTVLAALGPAAAAATAVAAAVPPSAAHFLPHHHHTHVYSNSPHHNPAQHNPRHGTQLLSQLQQQGMPPSAVEPYLALHQLYQGPHLGQHNRGGASAAPGGVTHGSAVAAATPAGVLPVAGTYGHGRQPGYGAVVF